MNESPFAFHQGEALMRLAKTYPTLLEVVLECVQNAIDKNATEVGIEVNHKSRLIVVRDNGDGVTQPEFEKALVSVCTSKKRSDQLGRYGLGLIAPVDKCEQMLFTSTPKKNPHDYKEWKFVGAELAEQHEISGIPMTTHPDLWYGSYTGGRGVAGVSWRTQVRIEKFTKDRFVSRVTTEMLRDGILERYSEAMRRRGTVVNILTIDADGEKSSLEVRSKDYDGEKLPEISIAGQDAGPTYFHLYIARRAAHGRTGKVKIGEHNNDFRVAFGTFAHNLPAGCKLADETVSALSSGIFEGKILTTKARFQSNRRSFEANDALIGFCCAIDQWYREVGTAYFKQAVAARKEEKYQDLGLRSLKVVEALLNDPAGSPLRDLIDTFKKGTIGSGHVDMPGRMGDVPVVSIHGGGEHAPAEEDGHARHEVPTTEHKAHHPLTVAGPKGSPRKIVRSNSLGLQLIDEALESDRLFLLDPTEGVLTINVRHPEWVRCEEEGNEKILGRFEEFLIVSALGMQTMPDEWRDIARLAFDVMVSAHVFLLLNSDVLAGRTPSRKKEDAEPTAAKKKKIA